MYIEDCIEGTLKVFNSKKQDVYNVGSEEQVSINQLVEIAEGLANYKVKKNYQLDKPKGVRGRNSNNDKIIDEIGWKPKINLEKGLKKTFDWIQENIKSGDNTNKFTKNY